MSLIEGKVVRVAQESIHVIVLGFSSAIIIEEDIRDELRYKVVCTFYTLVLWSSYLFLLSVCSFRADIASLFTW